MTGKATSIIYFECVSVALFNEHAKLMHRTVICGMLATPYFFPHYLISDTVFRERLL